MLNNSRRLAPFILLAGDLIAVYVFVLLGQQEHGTANPTSPFVGALFETGLFALPWVVAGWLLGAFRVETMRPADETRSLDYTLLGRSLTTWFVALPLGILLRAFALQRALIPTPFFVAALVFGGAFVLGWRILFVLLERFALRARPSNAGQA